MKVKYVSAGLKNDNVDKICRSHRNWGSRLYIYFGLWQRCKLVKRIRWHDGPKKGENKWSLIRFPVESNPQRGFNKDIRKNRIISIESLRDSKTNNDSRRNFFFTLKNGWDEGRSQKSKWSEIFMPHPEVPKGWKATICIIPLQVVFLFITQTKFLN